MAEDAQPYSTFNTNDDSSRDITPNITNPIIANEAHQSFPFLRLPFELRLKIYDYLLPPRHHKIVTERSYNDGLFYKSSPFTISPTTTKTIYYKVLTTNFRSSYPHPTIHTAILRASRQLKQEAEIVLYGNPASTWDFGAHPDACVAFWCDRGASARSLVRSLRVGREVPQEDEEDEEDDDGEVYDREREGRERSRITEAERWLAFGAFLCTEMTALNTLDLTVWGRRIGSGGDGRHRPDYGYLPATAERRRGGRGGVWETVLRKGREWQWIWHFLHMDSAPSKSARITWWGFGGQNVDAVANLHADAYADIGSQSQTFNYSWLARRMISDQLLRERTIKAGGVVEVVVTLSGGDCDDHGGGGDPGGPGGPGGDDDCSDV